MDDAQSPVTEYPQTGGTWERNEDGTLTQIEPPTAPPGDQVTAEE